MRGSAVDDDGLVERGQQHHQHQAADDDQDLPAGELRRRIVARCHLLHCPPPWNPASMVTLGNQFATEDNVRASGRPDPGDRHYLRR